MKIISILKGIHIKDFFSSLDSSVLCSFNQSFPASVNFWIHNPMKKVNKDVRIGELLTFPWGEKLVNEYLLGYLNMAIYGNFNTDKPIVNGSVDDNFFDSIMKDMPLRSLCNFSKGSFTEEMLTEFCLIHKMDLVQEEQRELFKSVFCMELF